MDRLTEITLNAYAKINLTLDILGVEDDGYHGLLSVMQTISLHDIITIRRCNPGIYVKCSDPRIPSDCRNLAYRAAKEFCAATGIIPEFEINVQKQIPNQAGLGGGSSDAATVLVALNKMYDEPLTQCVLYNIGARIGSDVPFFIHGGTALVTRRGECIETLPDTPEYHLVVVKPNFGISTAWAYRRLDEMRKNGSAELSLISKTNSMVECINAGKWEKLPDLLANDLERPSIERYPAIGDIKRTMISIGAKGTLMCGSGSAVFGIFGGNEDAVSASTKLNAYGNVYTIHTIHPNMEVNEG
ncbi:MAG: 4-(cytidine 5'-diphospho)-2-C-methyl-D-erythritol kinase [Armatimonadota bacterium]